MNERINKAEESERVCECCALVIANGDNSCRVYYGHTHGDPVGFWVLGDEWTEAGCFGDTCAACGVKRDHYEPMLEAYRARPLGGAYSVEVCDCEQRTPAPPGWQAGDEQRISCGDCAQNTAYPLATFGEPAESSAVIVCPQCGEDVNPGELMHVTGPLAPEALTVETDKGPVPVRLSPGYGHGAWPIPRSWRVFSGAFYAGSVAWTEAGYKVESPSGDTWYMVRHATLSDAVSGCIGETGRAI